MSRLERSSINIETFSKKGIFMLIRLVNKEQLEQHYNWAEIQKDYDNSYLSYKELFVKFQLHPARIKQAIQFDLFKPRPRNKQNPKSKDKLRKARINYLKNNPDKPAWKKHNKFDSIPCQKVKEWLKSQNIQFIEEFQPLLHLNRFFSIDIAFPDKKIGIEINGGQHYDTNGNLKEYYQKRHDLIESEGWTLHEIPYNKAFTQDFLDSIPKILEGQNKIEFDYKIYQKRGRKQYIAKHPNNVKYKYPSDDELRLLASQHRLIELVNILKIPMKPLYWHLTNRNIKCIKKQAKIRQKIPRKTKIQWPSNDDLKFLILNNPMTKVGKILGVSDNAVRKHCKKHNLCFD